MPDLLSFPIAQRWLASNPRPPAALSPRLRPTASRSRSCSRRSACRTSRTLSTSLRTKARSGLRFAKLRMAAYLRSSTQWAQTVSRSAFGNPARSLFIWRRRPTSFVLRVSAKRYEALSWVFFQMSAIGLMFGQLGFFARGGKDYEEKRPCSVSLMNPNASWSLRPPTGRARLIVDDYSIADIATLGWVNALVGEPTTPATYCGLAIIRMSKRGWIAALARPAVQRGLPHSGEVSMSVIAAYYYNEGRRIREVAIDERRRTRQEPFGLLLDWIPASPPSTKLRALRGDRTICIL